MSFHDAAGTVININDDCAILGTITAVTELTATVELTKYGSVANIVFAREEPIKYTVDAGQFNGVITGDVVDEGDQVLIHGTVIALTSGIRDVALVSVVEQGEHAELTLFTNELYTATVDGSTISGALSNPT